MDVIQNIKKLFADCIAEHKIFTYSTDNLKAVAFLNGLKHDRLSELKSMLKNQGFDYSYVYECYIFKNKNCNELSCLRKEKNKFIENLISWKFAKYTSDLEAYKLKNHEQIRN